MRRTMRRHVIVSQGGKTGPGGTFLRDTNVSDEVAEHIPDTLIAVAHEPGKPSEPVAPPKPAEKPAEKPSVLPPMTPTPDALVAPGSVKALRRWSAPKMGRLAAQEGIEAEGLDKDGLRRLLAAHLRLK